MISIEHDNELANSDKPANSVNKVIFKLPAFYEEDLRSWINTIECIFHSNKKAKPLDKYYALRGALLYSVVNLPPASIMVLPQ